MTPEQRREALVGCLLGTALGDAVGLAVEGLSPQRQGRLFGPIFGPRLLGRRGLVSDDTEHACFVLQALLASGGEPEAFAAALAGELRRWLLLLPAGVGWATLRATVKLWLGFSPANAGVDSAGNGPAMRAGPLGVWAGDQPDRLRALVAASSRLTHRDPRAEEAARLVALAAWQAATAAPGTIEQRAAALGAAFVASGGDPAGEVACGFARAATSAARGENTATFAAGEGWIRGVSGFAPHTVAAALHAALRHPTDLRAAIGEAVAAGGDTDTVAAITGAVVGAGVGAAGLPADWLAALVEWPRNVDWLTRLAGAAAAARADDSDHGVGREGASLPPPEPLALWLLARNLFFLALVLGHGLRRLLPPY